MRKYKKLVGIRNVSVNLFKYSNSDNLERYNVRKTTFEKYQAFFSFRISIYDEWTCFDIAINEPLLNRLYSREGFKQLFMNTAKPQVLESTLVVEDSKDFS
jgi:hypothetical protein